MVLFHLALAQPLLLPPVFLIMPSGNYLEDLRQDVLFHCGEEGTHPFWSLQVDASLFLGALLLLSDGR